MSCLGLWLAKPMHRIPWLELGNASVNSSMWFCRHNFPGEREEFPFIQHPMQVGFFSELKAPELADGSSLSNRSTSS